MATDRPQSTSGANASLLGLAAFVVVVGFFLFVSTKAGTRATGALTIVWALVQQLQGRIAYGWEGQPPSGYITGGLATLLNVVFGVLGLGMVIWPEIAMGILGWDRG